MSTTYSEESVFTISFNLEDRTIENKSSVANCKRDVPSFDVAVVEFDDEGKWVDETQHANAADRIKECRENILCKNGVIVLAFIHGWHHSAEWGDSHFVAFRRVLRALSIREYEREESRRVIGIYIGWNGDPCRSPFRDTPFLKHLSFHDRYNTAKKISEHIDLYTTVEAITLLTKNQIPETPPSQLILTGHSMGGLILESALLKFTKKDRLPKVGKEPDNWTIKTHIDEQPIAFPDAIITLNSAADSKVCKELKDNLKRHKVNKTVESKSIQYSPPLIISATSRADKATKCAWRLMRPSSKTTGHDKELHTHDFVGEEGTVECKTLPGVPDYGQSYHVIRVPEPMRSKTPMMRIDLPVRDRMGENDRPPHKRYRLDPKGSVKDPKPIWIFQIPPEIVKDHNDIFNSRSSSLILALMQISGTVGSMARDWVSSFEEY